MTDHYNKNYMLGICLESINCDFIEFIESSAESIQKNQFFTIQEIIKNLLDAYDLILIAKYQNVCDSLRRSIELVFITSHLMRGDVKSSQEWLKSQKYTPNKLFDKFLDYINATRILNFNDELIIILKQDFKKLWKIYNDKIHSNGAINVLRSNQFNSTICTYLTDIFLYTVKFIIICMVMINPMLSLEFREIIDSKYGYCMGPGSGYLYKYQLNRLRYLIGEKYRKYFDEISSEKYVVSQLDYFSSMTDLSEEEQFRLLSEGAF